MSYDGITALQLGQRSETQSLMVEFGEKKAAPPSTRPLCSLGSARLWRAGVPPAVAHLEGLPCSGLAEWEG